MCDMPDELFTYINVHDSLIAAIGDNAVRFLIMQILKYI